MCALYIFSSWYKNNVYLDGGGNIIIFAGDFLTNVEDYSHCVLFWEVTSFKWSELDSFAYFFTIFLIILFLILTISAC